MSEQEAIGAEIAAAVDVLAALWPGLVGEPREVAQAWLWVIGEDVRPGEVAQAVKRLLREPDRAYPPRPGEVLAEVRVIRKENDPRKIAMRQALQRLREEEEAYRRSLEAGERVEREIPRFVPKGLDSA